MQPADARRFERAYVIGACVPNGGTHMAYHLGRILAKDFGIPATAVRIGAETPDHGVFDYDLRMAQITLAEFEAAVGANDLVIVNPSFSARQFGARLPGFKICYVQGFTTYALLDRNLDHYVAVSDFVSAFLRTTYGLQPRIIPPFVTVAGLPSSPDWAQRPPLTVLVHPKGLPEVWQVSWQRLQAIVQRQAPEIVFEMLPAGGIPQRDLLARIGAFRYLLTLSAAEGFGLVPLEAMALGTLVVGYDGFGGRHYLRDAENCRVAPYPEIERVAQLLIDAVRAPEESAALARRGPATAAKFSYAAFRDAWIDEFSRILRIAPRLD